MSVERPSSAPGRRSRVSSTWVDAGAVIRQLRSLVISEPPRLRPALCPHSGASIPPPRTRAPEPIAA
jgi:hypothetical protein